MLPWEGTGSFMDTALLSPCCASVRGVGHRDSAGSPFYFPSADSDLLTVGTGMCLNVGLPMLGSPGGGQQPAH